MKNLIKFKFISRILVVLVFVLQSCNQVDDFEDGNMEPSLPVKNIEIGFGLELESLKDNLRAGLKNAIVHNYEKQGYKVIVEGGIVGGNQVFKHVDLNQKLEIEITGPIQVTVLHLGYKEDQLQKSAYFGTVSQEINPIEGQNNIVTLDLVQGYVWVTTSSFIEGFIDYVKINNQDVDFNSVYYVGASEEKVQVDLKVFGRVLKGQHTNILGEGMVYDLTVSDIIGNNHQKKQYYSFDDLKLEQLHVKSF